MSDGLTDGYRASLAAVRRNMLFQSLLASLDDRSDQAKRDDAVCDVIAFERQLIGIQAPESRESAAANFLEHLHDREPAAWSKLLAFALNHESPELARLKRHSPFSGKILVLANRADNRIRLASLADLEAAIIDSLALAPPDAEGSQLLIALDYGAVTHFTFKP